VSGGSERGSAIVLQTRLSNNSATRPRDGGPHVQCRTTSRNRSRRRLARRDRSRPVRRRYGCRLAHVRAPPRDGSTPRTLDCRHAGDHRSTPHRRARNRSSAGHGHGGITEHCGLGSQHPDPRRFAHSSGCAGTQIRTQHCRPRAGCWRNTPMPSPAPAIPRAYTSVSFGGILLRGYRRSAGVGMTRSSLGPRPAL